MVAPAAESAAGAAAKSDAPAKSMEAEAAALEARLARDGGTADDWTLLAKAYDFLGRPTMPAAHGGGPPIPLRGWSPR